MLQDRLQQSNLGPLTQTSMRYCRSQAALYLELFNYVRSKIIQSTFLLEIQQPLEVLEPTVITYITVFIIIHMAKH